MVRTRNCTYSGPSEITAGNRQQLSIETEVLNGDTSPYEYTLALLVDGQQITSKSGSIGETTKKDESISAPWTAPNSDGSVDVSVEIVNEDQQSPGGGGGGGGGGGDDDEGGGGSDEPETTITAVDISPSDITDGQSFTASATVSHNGPDDNVGVIFRLAGRDVATGSRTVSAGTDVIAQDISWSRLTNRGIAPSSGQITVPVQAVLDGQTVEADQQLTLTKGSTGSDPPRNGGGGDDDEGGGGSDEPETTITAADISPSDITDGQSFTASATVSHNGPDDNVGVIFRVAGRDVATGSRTVSAGTDVIAQDISWSRLTTRGVAPSSGQITVPVQAILDGQTVEADQQLTLTKGSTGSDPPRNGGGGEDTDPGGPELVSVGPTTTSVQAGTDLTLSADVAHNGESEEVTLVWRVDGREISTSTGEIGPGNDPNNDGESTFQTTISYDRLERRGVVPSTGTNDATIEARLSGTDNWVDWGGTVTIFSTRGGRPQMLTARVPGVGDVDVPREKVLYQEQGYRSRSPRRRNERQR